MLKLVVEKIEDVEEAFRSLYKQGGDGKFYLQTEEDADTKKKIAEFRDNNVKLMKEKEELEKKFAGIDPEKVAELQRKVQAIDDKKMIDAGKIDELVAQKVERMRQDFENQINAMKNTIDEKEGALHKSSEKLSEVLIDSEITKAVTAVGGVRKDAMQDILSRGRRLFRLEEGKPIPKEGDRILYGKDGKEPMTFEEWAKILTETAPFLFEGSGGSGSSGNQGASAAVGFANMTKDAIAKLPPSERLRLLHGDPTAKK